MRHETVEDRTEVCTLRAAIQEAHVSTGMVKITSESRTIQLVKPLPTIQNPLEFNLNGTTIDSTRSNTPASGLHINSEATTVRGVVIHSFTGDRILYEGPSESPLTLVDVESSGNCGWGLRILNNPLVVHGILRTSNNGTGERREAGGLLVQGAITDASDGFVETRGNNGPGLVAHDDISTSLLGFESSDNIGPGTRPCLDP